MTDHFVTENGKTFAGKHLLVDLWGATLIDDPVYIEAALRQMARRAGATVLGGSFRQFSPSGGVSGVLLLAESHISIHTWPERQFSAVDVFMCGTCDPHATLPVLRGAFQPGHMTVQEVLRALS